MSLMLCQVGQRSRQPCGPHANSPLQTLDELDAASLRIPGKTVKISWMILSRVGVNFLQGASYGWWTICPNHRKEYLDAWQVGKTCCHPVHKGMDFSINEPPTGLHMVTTLMSIKMLQTDGLVVPISGKFCQMCKDNYETRYGGRPAEKIVVFMPTPSLPLPGNAPAVPSPFCHPDSPHKPHQDQRPISFSPPPPTRPSAAASGFLMHTTLTPPKKKGRMSNNSNRNKSAATSFISRPEPVASPPPQLDLPVWQVLGLQRAAPPPKEVSPPTATADISGGLTSHETPDDHLASITIKIEVDDPVPVAQPLDAPVSTEAQPESQEQRTKPQRKQPQPQEKAKRQKSSYRTPPTVQQVVVDDYEEEERPLTAMSMFYDSDDDPTWAPSPMSKSSATEPKSRKSTPLKSLEKRLKPEVAKSKRSRKKKEKPVRKIKPKKRDKENGGMAEWAAVAAASGNDTKPDSLDAGLKPQDVVSLTNAANEFHFLCSLCQISFYRQTAYKHHMSTNVELHRQLEEKFKTHRPEKEIFHCKDCKQDFKDRTSYQRHMAEEHSSGEHPFFCRKCNVYLKSEAAFKSHNSKLHLERRARACYCRVCDAIFYCKIKHANHIVTHRVWPNGETGMQCKVCGKVFNKSQSLTYQKHLSTHDDDMEQPCTCRDCHRPARPAKEDSLAKGSKRAAVDLGSMFAKMQNNFNGDDEDDVDEEAAEEKKIEDEFLLPFECGICSQRFATVQVLEGHVISAHKDSDNSSSRRSSTRVSRSSSSVEASPSKASFRIVDDEISLKTLNDVTNEFVAEIDNENRKAEVASADDSPKKSSTALSRMLVENSRILILKPTEKNWQECAARNWAAEFGYGGGKGSSTDTALKKRSVDLISKMKSKFFSDENDDNEESEEDEEKDNQVYRSRGLKGADFVRASPGKEPRTLSSSSLRSRKRMEALLQRARDFMRKRDRKLEEEDHVEEEKVEPEEDEDHEVIISDKSLLLNKIDSMEAKEIAAPETDKSPPETEISPPPAKRPRRGRPPADRSASVSKPQTPEKRKRKVAVVKVPSEANENYVSNVSSVNKNAVIDKPEVNRRKAATLPPEPEVDSDDVQDEAVTHQVEEEHDESDDEDVDEEEEDEDEDDEEFSDFECILDVDDESDGLLIPLENGWVCEKNWSSRSGTYSTHFWSPDGRRHSSLTVIKFYGEKKKLNLNMAVFERALKNNPPRKSNHVENTQPYKGRKSASDPRTTRSRSGQH